jgi:uncharacterized protein
MGRRLSPGFFAALISALVTVLICSTAWADFEVPPKPASNPVYDGVDALTPAQETQLGSRLVDFKKKHGIEIGVAIIPSLGEGSIKEVGYEIASTWGIGDKERKDGVLLLVVADAAKKAGPGASKCGCLRIEVGEYLEGDLTDGTSKEILVKEALAPVTSGKYHEAVDGALNGIMAVVGGDSEAAKQYKNTADSGGVEDETPIPWWVWVGGIALLLLLQFVFKVPILDILLIFLSFGGGRGGGGGGGGGNSVGGGGSFGGGGGDV